jgi:hypothetical protein
MSFNQIFIVFLKHIYIIYFIYELQNFELKEFFNHSIYKKLFMGNGSLFMGNVSNGIL